MPKHTVFPEVPRGFWCRFRKLWGHPLRQFEETITLAQSFGADPTASCFDCMDEEYWAALRGLHSRTCLHARAVLALLTNGLVDPAWAQWRICHEAATTALFIAKYPDKAHRYLHHSPINRYHLAKTLYDTGHHDAPSEPELKQLEVAATSAKQAHKQKYGSASKSRDYGWSGLSRFQEIETAAEKDWNWKARPEYVFASGRIHAAPSSVEPVLDAQGRRGFQVGPTNAGLTGPADLTCLSLVRATVALMHNAVADEDNKRRLAELNRHRRAVGVGFWMSDPAILCPDCGGHVPEASPPEEIPDSYKPAPCSCNHQPTGC